MADDKNVDKEPKQNDWSPLQNSEQQHQNSTTTETSQQNQLSAQSVQESGNGGTKLEPLEVSGATDSANVSNNSSTERKLGTKGVKNEEKKIFVGGISWDTTEEDLKGFFGQFGEVSHVQIKYDHFTGRSRGFAFVEFLNPDSCQQALEHKDREIKGKKCEVKPAKSRENKKIFIGGLPADFSEDELRKHFEQFGKLEEIEWPYDKFQNKRKNFAFVVFEDEDATQKAAQQQKQKFGDRMCDVKIAVPQYMRPQRQYGATGGWGTGWSDYGNYGGYSGYGGGYGGYYDDYYSNYDYTGAGNLDYSSNWQGGGGIRYDGWSYGGAAAAASVGGGGNSGTTRGARSAYPTYGGY